MWNKRDDYPEPNRKVLLKVKLTDVGLVVHFEGHYNGESYVDWCGDTEIIDDWRVIGWRYLDELA